MAVAKIFQRFGAPVSALVLSISSMLPFNAQAQEPAQKPTPSPAATLTTLHQGPSTKSVFTRATSEFTSAHQHAQKANEVAFWIVLPEGGRYTPEKAGEILVAQLAQRGVPAHAFGRNSPKDGGMAVVVYIGDGVYENPMTGTTDFDLRSIIPQLNIIAEQYLKIQPSDRIATNKAGPESAP